MFTKLVVIGLVSLLSLSSVGCNSESINEAGKNAYNNAKSAREEACGHADINKEFIAGELYVESNNMSESQAAEYYTNCFINTIGDGQWLADEMTLKNGHYCLQVNCRSCRMHIGSLVYKPEESIISYHFTKDYEDNFTANLNGNGDLNINKEQPKQENETKVDQPGTGQCYDCGEWYSLDQLSYNGRSYHCGCADDQSSYGYSYSDAIRIAHNYVIENIGSDIEEVIMSNESDATATGLVTVDLFVCGEDYWGTIVVSLVDGTIQIYQ